MKREKLHRLSKVASGASGLGRGYEGTKENWRGIEVLYEASRHWLAMDMFRKERERNKNYAYGRQWEDIIEYDGKKMRERDYIISQGNIPLKNNLIRRMVQAVLGVYRSQSKEPMCTARDRDEQGYGETMTTVLQYNMQLNRMQEMLARCFEEFLISGFVVMRKWYGWRNDKLDCWSDYVQPNNFFIDSNMRDFRGWDVSCLGEVHDISFEELCERFAQNPGDLRRLQEIYSFAKDKAQIGSFFDNFGYPIYNSDYDFFVSSDPTRCRVIEVWKKTTKARYRCHDLNNGDIFKIEIEDYEEFVVEVNERRLREGAALGVETGDIPLVEAQWFIDSYWYRYLLSPFGDILEEGETPYEHKSHPYVFKAWPFIDGEIHSFVANVIDQQRYTNRLITMYDWIMRASAKGVLLFPEECMPEGMSMEDVAEEWARFDGIIMIKQPKGSALPHQIANNCTQIGISELLSMQLKFFEDISGVNGAIQGKPGFSGMSASLYSQQTQNATNSLLDVLDSFAAFVKEGATKDVKNIQQYYDTPRVFNIAGRGANLIEYDPKKIRDVEFDLSIEESTATPAYRAIANDFLMQLWQSQAISVEQLLENGDFPFADRLLQSIQAQKQQMEAQQAQLEAQQGQMGDGIR